MSRNDKALFHFNLSNRRNMRLLPPGLGFSELVEGNKYEFLIPSYQRSYAWDEEDVEGLLNPVMDITSDWQKRFNEASSYAQNEFNPAEAFPSFYALNAVSVMEFDRWSEGSEDRYGFEFSSIADNSLALVDGQQRVTTLIVLVAALRDFVAKNVEDLKGKGTFDSLPETATNLRIVNPRDNDFRRAFDSVLLLEARNHVEPRLRRMNALRRESEVLVNLAMFTGEDCNPDISLDRGKIDPIKHAYETALRFYQEKFLPEGDISENQVSVEMFFAALMNGVRIAVNLEEGSDTEAVNKKFITLNRAGKSLTNLNITQAMLVSKLDQSDADDIDSKLYDASIRLNKPDKVLATIYNAYMLPVDGSVEGKAPQKARANTVEGKLEAFLEDADVQKRKDAAETIIDGFREAEQVLFEGAVVTSCDGTNPTYPSYQHVPLLAVARKFSDQILLPVMAAPVDSKVKVAEEWSKALILAKLMGVKLTGGAIEEIYDTEAISYRQGTKPSASAIFSRIWHAAHGPTVPTPTSADVVAAVRELRYNTSSDKPLLRAVFSVVQAFIASPKDDKVSPEFDLDHLHPKSNTDSELTEDQVHCIGNLTPLEAIANQKKGARRQTTALPASKLAVTEISVQGSSAFFDAKVTLLSDPQDKVYEEKTSTCRTLAAGLHLGEALSQGESGTLSFNAKNLSPEIVDRRAEAIAKMFVEALDGIVS